MWLRYLIFMYSITHALATEILYDTKDFSSSSKNNSNNVLHSLYFVSNNKKINEQQSIRTTKSSDFQLTESVINDILISNQQGRNLNNYAAIYDDSEVKNVLKLKNNTLSRTYIQNKLCSLGLMNCNNLNESDPQYLSRRDIHPHDNVYIQSVRTKPLSIPVPVIPVNDPENFNDYKLGRIGYNPVFLGLTPPSTSFNIHNLSSFIKQQPLISSSVNPTNEQSTTIYNVKPVYEIGFDKDFNYDNKFINKKEIIIQPDSNIQQHIHHHFHHNDAKEGIVPIIGSGLINNNAFNNNGHENIGSLYNYYEEHKKKKNLLPDNSFLGDSLSNNYADRYHLYGNLMHDSVLNKINIQSGSINNKNFSYKIEPLNKFNNYYGNKNFEVSKEFNVNNNFGFNNEFGQKNAATNGLSKTNYNDCICVLYEQCIMLGKAGRKDDLYLAIDPRNLGTNIAADSKDLIKSNNDVTINISRLGKNNNTTKLQNNKNEKIKTSDENKEVIQNKETKYFEKQRITRNVNKSINNKEYDNIQSRQIERSTICGPQKICCRRHQIYLENNLPNRDEQCGVKYNEVIAGRIKTPDYIDGESEFGEYPWQAAILKKEREDNESVYICGGTLISLRAVITAAHCIKAYSSQDLRVRLGEWDVNHDVEFFPYIERDIDNVVIHPEFYAGRLYNDIAILKLNYDIDFSQNPHISPVCLPHKYDDFFNIRCWTTGWGKNAFGNLGTYQNILKEVDVPIISNNICERQMRKTRLGMSFNLHPGFMCAGGEEGKDACKGDGGGPMVCERHGKWQLAGIVSWGIGCGQNGVPGIYSRVSYYLDWIQQIIRN